MKIFITFLGFSIAIFGYFLLSPAIAKALDCTSPGIPANYVTGAYYVLQCTPPGCDPRLPDCTCVNVCPESLLAEYCPDYTSCSSCVSINFSAMDCGNKGRCAWQGSYTCVVPTPTPTPTPSGCQTNADCGVCKQCCAGSPNYCSAWGYYCNGSIISECWATPTPIPTSSPGSTPTPTPIPTATPTPPPGPNCPYWCANNAEQCGAPCVQYPEYICDQPQQMCCQCPEITPPPVTDKPPPVFQTIMEVRNVTKGEQFIDDCGGGDCRDQPSWPSSCSRITGSSRPLQTQTRAAPGNTVAVRICERNLGEPTHKNIDALWWLNQARPGEKTVAQAGENIDCELPGQPTFGCHDWIIRPPPSIYPYHQQYGHTLNIPYDWFRWSESNCGANDLWNYACVKSQTFYFTVKNDPNLLNQIISTRASVKTGPYVKPADYHRVESGCNVNWGTAQGFYDRQPECCWGDPTKAEGWYGRCTELDRDPPPPGNCRFGTCNTGEYSEDFFFWSNWIKINVRVIAPWIQVTGDVHSNKRIRAPGGP